MNFKMAVRRVLRRSDVKLNAGQKEQLLDAIADAKRCEACERFAESHVRQAGRGRFLKARSDRRFGWDWSGLLEFLAGLLPIILAFIDAFN